MIKVFDEMIKVFDEAGKHLYTSYYVIHKHWGYKKLQREAMVTWLLEKFDTAFCELSANCMYICIGTKEKGEK